MAINVAELALTLSHTPHLEVVESTGSTNADARRHGADWPHMAVLLTDDQTAGRGRLDRQWQAPAGSSLAMSVVLHADRVPAAGRGWVPLIAGLAMCEAVGAQLGEAVAVKWPNDVLVGQQKICGILAEITADGRAIVVGSGVNTAMTAEQAPVESATSFAMHGTTAHLDLLISHYLGRLNAEVEALAAAGGDAEASGLRERVIARCATVGKVVTVHLPGDGTLIGEAVSIDADGRLVVVSDGESHAISAGDVVHVR